MVLSTGKMGAKTGLARYGFENPVCDKTTLRQYMRRHDSHTKKDQGLRRGACIFKKFL